MPILYDLAACRLITFQASIAGIELLTFFQQSGLITEPVHVSEETSVTFQLQSWPRPLYEKTGDSPFLLYCVYGEFRELPTLRGEQYNSAGVPAGMKLELYNKGLHNDIIGTFLTGEIGNLLRQKEDLCHDVTQCRQLIVFKGLPMHSTTLDYLRDAVGVLSYLLDNGGVGILDPQALIWWRPQEWRHQFASSEMQALRHITIVESADENDPDKLWMYTRGCRKFGRPDISVRRIDQAQKTLFFSLIERFASFHALGGVIQEDEEFPTGYDALAESQPGSGLDGAQPWHLQPDHIPLAVQCSYVRGEKALPIFGSDYIELIVTRTKKDSLASSLMGERATIAASSLNL